MSLVVSLIQHAAVALSFEASKCVIIVSINDTRHTQTESARTKRRKGTMYEGKEAKQPQMIKCNDYDYPAATKIESRQPSSIRDQRSLR